MKLTDEQVVIVVRAIMNLIAESAALQNKKVDADTLFKVAFMPDENLIAFAKELGLSFPFLPDESSKSKHKRRKR